MQGGRKTGSNRNAEAYRAFVRGWEAAAGSFTASLEAARNLLYPDRAAAALSDSVQRADTRLAMLIFGLAALITFLLSAFTMFESLWVAQYMADTMASMTDSPVQIEGSGMISSLIVHQAIISIPVALVFLAAHELLVFGMARATGGRGRLDQQLYLSSLVSLSVAFASAVYLFTPLPCLNIAAMAALLIWSAYLALYVNPKAYALVHGVSFLHAFIMNIVPLALRVAAVAFLSGALATALGIPVYVQGA